MKKPFFPFRLIQQRVRRVPGTALGLSGMLDVTWRVWQRGRGPGREGWPQRRREVVHLPTGDTKASKHFSSRLSLRGMTLIQSSCRAKERKASADPSLAEDLPGNNLFISLESHN